VIGKDALIEQVSEATVTTEDGDHLVQMYQSNLIYSEGDLKSVQQASGFLQMGDWTPVAPTCGVPECCRPDHLDDAHIVKDEEDLQLVASHAVSLADLYRQGRKRGLLSPQSSGYGG
jgi:hypothetical protein